MTYRLFQYPLPGPPELEDLNSYLASHRVAAVTQHLVQTASGAMLVFIVQTVQGEAPGKNRSRRRRLTTAKCVAGSLEWLDKHEEILSRASLRRQQRAA
jgi:hypothetical protein